MLCPKKNRSVISIFGGFLALLMACGACSGQVVVAHYDFEAGLGDMAGGNAALSLVGGATWEAGRVKFTTLNDHATVTIPNGLLYTAGTQALEVDAWLRADGFIGYGITTAEVLKLYTGWDAVLEIVQDKWAGIPRVVGGAGREVASAAQMGPYLQLGISHHLQIVLDTQKCCVWMDGQLVAQRAAVGDLALFNRPGVAAFEMGAFRGVMEEVKIIRHTVVPQYVDQTKPFAMTGCERLVDGRLCVQWNSRPGTEYTIELSHDLVTWTPQPLLVMTASQLVSKMTVPAEGPARQCSFARVRLGNAFDGQGPLLLSHIEGATLAGSSATVQWLPNSVGVEEWIVKAGSTAGGSQFFQSLSLPSTSTQFPVTNLPTRGETVFVTIRYRKGVSWYDKTFTFTASHEEDLPAEREGLFPIARPSYNGVSQILVLSNRWVVAAVEDLPDVMARINTLSGGQFQAMIDLGERGAPAGNGTNWTAWTQVPAIRDTYITQARLDLNEDRYTQPSYYAISSVDDPAYPGTAQPLHATQFYVGQDKGRVAGSHQCHYSHYCYLEMPQPMVNGKHYRIQLADGKWASFLYDEQRTVSRAIKVNQAGYLPDSGKKYAYIGADVYGYGPLPLGHTTTFSVINAQTGAVALTGPVTLREANPRFSVKLGNTEDPLTRPFMLGEDVYQMDLAGLTQSGNFFISVPGVGRSWTFRHAADAYGEPFYLATRGLFHQRASMKYALPYTPWVRAKAHTDPIYESALVCFGFGQFNPPASYNRFDIVGATLDKTKATPNVEGGWYDAADWDRNIRHYTCMFDMLNAYELAPAKFTDGQLNIPESGNGVPDILDEVEYGLEAWTRSMTAEGGVSGWIETSTHPTMTDPAYQYGYSQRTRWSTLIYAAAAAQLAEMLAPMDSARSAKYRALAIKAYGWGSNVANSLGNVTIPAKTNRGVGTPYTITWTEDVNYNDPYMFTAKLRLYYLTGDTSYLTNIETYLAHGATPWGWPNTMEDCVPWFYYPIAKRGAGIFSPALIATWKAKFTQPADSLLAHLETMPYRHTWPRYQDYWIAWGESNLANRGRVLLQAFSLTGDTRYRDAALCNMDYMFGSNAMGMSWTSGIGAVYPAVFQHAVSETDGIDDPVPGLTIYGLDGGPINYVVRDNAWASPVDAAITSRHSFYADPNAPFFRRWVAHPTVNTGQCEFTVHETMSSTIFNCAMFLPDGWTPPASLKQRKPRHRDSLFGFWYLP